MLKKFQDMGKLLKQAKEMKDSMGDIQKELKKTQIPVSVSGGKIKVSLNGEMEVLSVEIDPSLLNTSEKKTLQNGLKKAFSEGIKKAKDTAAQKLTSISGGFLPGQ